MYKSNHQYIAKNCPKNSVLEWDDINFSGETFEFPDVVKKEQLEEKEVKADDDVERTKREFEKNTKIKQVGRKGLPTFFGL